MQELTNILDQIAEFNTKIHIAVEQKNKEHLIELLKNKFFKNNQYLPDTQKINLIKEIRSICEYSSDEEKEFILNSVFPNLINNNQYLFIAILCNDEKLIDKALHNGAFIDEKKYTLLYDVIGSSKGTYTRENHIEKMESFMDKQKKIHLFLKLNDSVSSNNFNSNKSKI